MKQKSLIILASFAVVGTLALTAGTVLAWTGPTGTFPAGNVEAPINTGNYDQVKGGGIGAKWFVGRNGIFNQSCVGNTCAVVQGQPVDLFQALNTGSGKGLRVDMTGNFFIKDGNQAAGKVLTSDASGKATWGTPSGLLPNGINRGDTLKWDDTTSKWLVSGQLVNLTGANTGSGDGVYIRHNGGALRLAGINQTFMNWEPDGAGAGRAWSGFGTANSKLFSIVNEFGATAPGITGRGGITLIPGLNGAVGINSGAPDSRNGTVLDVNGHIKIAQSGAAPGRVLTATDVDGFAMWQDPSSAPILAIVSSVNGHLNSGSRGTAVGYAHSGTVSICPTGYSVIGGGGDCANNFLDISQPVNYVNGSLQLGTAIPDYSNAWLATCDSSTTDIHSYAICAKMAPSSIGGGGGTPGPTYTFQDGTGQGTSGQSCDAWMGSSIGHDGSRARAVEDTLATLLSSNSNYRTYPSATITANTCAYKVPDGSPAAVITRGIGSGFAGDITTTRCIKGAFGTNPGYNSYPVGSCTDNNYTVQTFHYSGGPGSSQVSPDVPPSRTYPKTITSQFAR